MRFCTKSLKYSTVAPGLLPGPGVVPKGGRNGPIASACILCVSHSRKAGVAVVAVDDAAGAGTGTGEVSAVAVAAAPGCCWDWEGSREKGGWTGVDVPDVLGVGSPLEEVDEGGSGGGEVVNIAVPADGCDAWVCMPLMATAAAVEPETGLLWLLPLLLPLPLLPPLAP